LGFLFLLLLYSTVPYSIAPREGKKESEKKGKRRRKEREKERKKEGEKDGLPKTSTA
jgi:hypothetical protein